MIDPNNTSDEGVIRELRENLRQHLQGGGLTAAMGGSLIGSAILAVLKAYGCDPLQELARASS